MPEPERTPAPEDGAAARLRENVYAAAREAAEVGIPPERYDSGLSVTEALWLLAALAASRAEVARLQGAWLVDEAIQADGSLRPSVSATVSRAEQAERELAELTEAAKAAIGKHYVNVKCWHCDGVARLRAALARGE